MDLLSRIYILHSGPRVGFQRDTVTIKSNQIDDTINDFLVQIYNIYSSMSPIQLSNLTHVASGPWDITRRLGGFYTIIQDDLIKQHYLSKKHQDELAKK